MDKRKRRLLCMLEGSGRKSRWISGVPPLQYSAKKQGTLKNYRIYGNTVGGESVGDLVTSGEHAGEYKVPVTVAGKNLFDVSTITPDCYVDNEGRIIGNDDIDTSDFIKVFPNTNYTYKGVIIYNVNTIRIAYYDQSKNFISRHFIIGNAADGETVTTPSNCEYVKLSYDKVITNLMLNAGSTPLPYEPYHAPVTVPIYLPEQIRKVGDDAEYIDFAEQKQHRVRKNLLQNTATSQENNGVTFTVNSDGSVTCNGTASATASIVLQAQITLNSGSYILTGCPQGGGVNTNYKLDIIDPIASVAVAVDTGSGASLTLRQNMKARIVIYTGQVCDNLTFYPMIRKADITDDAYEPYIENTDLDVTLPALPTLPGTNVLSVGTAVQPSEIEVKGKIKAL